MLDRYRLSISATHADRIVSELQTQQHLVPHQSVGDALDRARALAGFCPVAARLAIESLRLDSTRKIGRLKGCELVQLGRAIYRHWRQASAAQAAPTA